MTIKKLYPGGKKKAFNVTYDDGIRQDIRFVNLLNTYGIKGTFNLNSGLMKNEFEWVHENGMIVKRLPESIAAELYQGHEIASHTLTHPYMFNLSEQQILKEMTEDKENLERLFGYQVSGFAVPFDYYSDLIEECVKKAGFEYGRCSQSIHSYAPSDNYFCWKAGMFHLCPELNNYVEGFVNCDWELALCQIVGHSYDLDAANMWGTMEQIFRKISSDHSIWCASTIEIVRYLKAMEHVSQTEKGIENHSDSDLWFEKDGKICAVHPGECL